ncbi:MAG: exodeoxyribonuclease III [Deltaproteobacteria bacterium]|nr:exodeoxyribonuclease III [Deltaproteobacteria bacterium]
MKAATFNANSIRARLPMVLDWLEREAPDILFVQETKVQDPDFPLQPVKDAGYHAVFRGQKSYNGVAILSKSPMNDVQTSLSVHGVDDARFISACIGDIFVINVYVPQGFQVGTEKFEFKLAWLRHLYRYITGNYDPASRLLVAGDFNVALSTIDLFDPKGYEGEVGFHPDEQAILQEVLDWGLKDLFRMHVKEGNHYTFWDYRIPNGFKRNMGWRIDYILGTRSMAERSRTVWIDTEARALKKPSDHTFLVAEFD